VGVGKGVPQEKNGSPEVIPGYERDRRKGRYKRVRDEETEAEKSDEKEKRR